MINVLLSGKQERGGQLGFTMIELMVALVVSGLLITGAMTLLRNILTIGEDNRGSTMATLQVQYVGFWISEDVVQAQTIELGNSSGFPLTITWTDWDGNENRVTYELEEMVGESGLRQLTRTHEVNEVSWGTSVVGQYLDPASTECYENPFEYISSLSLEVTASFGGSEASSTYEIVPRVFVTWLPEGA